MPHSTTSSGAARGVNGLHHITAIAGPAQENVDFYAGILGMHLVKRSVNQDDPGTYHLFYADAEGSPGTDLTFFPWARHGTAADRPRTGGRDKPGNPRGQPGLLERAARAIWRPLREDGNAVRRPEPAGRRYARVPPVARRKRRGSRPPIHAVGREPVSRRSGRFAGCTAPASGSAARSPRAAFLTGVLGFERLGEEDGWTRYGFGSAAGFVDVRETPNAPRGGWGVGAVHHLAWRVDDEAHQLAVRAAGRGRRRAGDRCHRSLLVQVGVLQGARRRAVRDRDRRPRVRDG